MRVYIWCDGAAMPNGGPAGAGYVVVGGVHLLGLLSVARRIRAVRTWLCLGFAQPVPNAREERRG